MSKKLITFVDLNYDFIPYKSMYYALCTMYTIMYDPNFKKKLCPIK